MYLQKLNKIGIASAIFLAYGCVKQPSEDALPYYNSPNFSAIFLSSKEEAVAKINHTIGQFSFKDQNGKTITDKDIEGKVHLASFIFTDCNSICPVMTKNLKKIDSTFSKNKSVVLLSFSVMPWIDNVEKLRKYAEKNGIRSAKWHLLTGSKSEIYDLARKGYFAEEDLGYAKDSTSFLHTEHFVLVDGSKRIRGIYNGTLSLEAEPLIKDIQVLIKN